jgi:uncharacterized membrane protein YfcA
MTQEIVAVLFGFLAGTLSALFGVGGGLTSRSPRRWRRWCR